MPDVTIQAPGLKEFARELRKAGDGLDKELGKAFQQIAKMVAEGATSKAQSLGGVAAKAASEALKTSKSSAQVAIKLATSSIPYAMGAEFGGGRRATTQQFQPWKGNGPEAGYFVYPTIRDMQPQIIEAYQAAVGKVTEKAFPNIEAGKNLIGELIH
jgi:hypothetical protein